MTNDGCEGRRSSASRGPKDGLETARGTLKKEIARIVMNQHRERGDPTKCTRLVLLLALRLQIPPTHRLVLYDPLRSFSVLVLNFANFGLQFLSAGVTLHSIQLNQGARMGDLSDRREARRFTMTLPVRVLAHEVSGPELKAHTRDVSYRGLYFLSESQFENGSEIDFIITLPQQVISAGDVNIRCHGRVVRVESTDNGKMGVAAKIERYEFVPVRATAA